MSQISAKNMDMVWNKQSCTIRIKDEVLFDKLHREVNHQYGPGIESSSGKKTEELFIRATG
jgi:hypothetical protein